MSYDEETDGVFTIGAFARGFFVDEGVLASEGVLLVGDIFFAPSFFDKDFDEVLDGEDTFFGEKVFKKRLDDVSFVLLTN